MDRRVARTRARLEDAHKALILRQDYETIRVEGICRAADVGRSTFYAHYAGKDDLKRRGLGHLRARLTAAQRAWPERRLAFVLPLFEHAAEQRDHIGALAGGRGGRIALAEIQAMLTDLVRGEPVRPGAGGTASTAPQAAFVVGGLMGLLAWWLEDGARSPPEQMAALAERLVGGGLDG